MSAEAFLGLSELHASHGSCQCNFFDHVPNTKAFFMAGGGGHAILANTHFCDQVGITHTVLEPESSHCLSWIVDGLLYVFVSFRFHPSDAAEKVRQLTSLRHALVALLGAHDGEHVVMLGGDRNFVTSADQKFSSATHRWHPGRNVLQALDSLLEAIQGYNVCPDEFTWHRHSEGGGFVSEVLDACMCNVDDVRRSGFHLVCNVAKQSSSSQCFGSFAD